MTVHQLVEFWEKSCSGQLTATTFKIRLPMEDAARIEALAEMYPKRSRESIITDLLSAALGDLVTGLPYVQGKQIIARDEEGEPIYEDVGPTPRYLQLTRKYLSRYRAVDDDKPQRPG